MIIAGYAGVGKTVAGTKIKNAIDFIVMPFKYLNFYEIADRLEGEDIKANKDLDFFIGWEEYYYFALLDTLRKYPEQIIIIPTVSSILKKFQKDNIPVTIVVPNVEIKEEYRKRYLNRGNSKEFIDIFIGGWENRINEASKYADNDIVILKSGEYLHDILKKYASDEGNIIDDKDNYIFEKYFKNGWDEEFLRTPFGQLLEGLGYGRK